MSVAGSQDFGLGLENTVWRGVKVASGKALVMIIYTGKNTKLTLNMKQASTKFGKIDQQLNFFSKILFLVMTSLSLLLILMNGGTGTVGDRTILFFNGLSRNSSGLKIKQAKRINIKWLTNLILLERKY